MNDREVILELLARVARRLSLNRSLQELGFGLSLVLLALLIYRLVQPALVTLPFGHAPAIAGALGVAVCLLYVLSRALRRATLAQAAGAVDVRAKLSDELKTAYWLSTQHDESPFAQLQISRAAFTSKRIDPAVVVPARWPQSGWSALLIGVLAFLAGVWAPQSAHSWQAGSALADALLTEDMGAPLQGMPPDESTRKLQEALSMLQREDASADDRRRALAQAREAQDEINLRATSAREALARLATAMAARDDDFREAGKALEQGKTAEALKALDRLARQLGADPEAVQDAQSNPDALPTDNEALAGELRRPDLKINEETLNQVSKHIEDAQSLLETQRRANQARRRLDDFLMASAQRSPLTAARFGNQASTPNPTPAPETGSANLPGGTMFRQGAVARGEDAQDVQAGSETGAAAGNAEALPVEGVGTERLEAKLRRETITATGVKEEAGEQGWVYKPTQGGNAQTRFAEVRTRESFTAADTPQREDIPVRQRGLVRDYFINLHKSEQ